MNAKKVYDLQRSLTGIHPLRTTFKNKTIKILNIKIANNNNQNTNVDNRTPGKTIVKQYLSSYFFKL